MNDLEPISYTFYVIGPFNSRMIIDNLGLIGRYEDFRKAMYKSLIPNYTDKILIEKLGMEPESIKKWLLEGSTRACVEDDDVRLFKKTGESGVTLKDKSLLVINVNETFELPKGTLNWDLFESAPKIVFESMNYHEYGIGMVYCKLEVSFKRDLLDIAKTEAKQIITNVLDAVITFPGLIERTKAIEKDVYEAYLKIYDEFQLVPPIISYEGLFAGQPSAVPLWGHIVIVRRDLDDSREDEIKQFLDNLIDISHPDGAVDFAEGTKGYVHIGWGNSLWAGLDDRELNYAKEILRYVEVEWRTLQVFNEVLYRRLNQWASFDTLHKKAIKQTMFWINELRMEMELYSLDKSNYLQNLAPFAHFVYNETVESWRISQMENFFKEKLEVFEYLHQQGKDTLNELSDSRINNILFIFTCLSLVSTFIDGLTFALADNIEELIPFRLFLLFFPPIAFIILILLIFSRMGAWKKKQRRC
ncbi:MAG: hypothetical protein ACFFAS_14025 [Promethearchaeota archaeon]